MGNAFVIFLFSIFYLIFDVYLLMIVLAYSLYQLFTNMQAGAKFAGKTRQAIAFEQLRTRRTHVVVYAGGYSASFLSCREIDFNE